MNSTIKFDTTRLEKTNITLGFIPLTDCAPLVVAKERGYFARYGLDVTLSKETSWANIRDKVALGILDGAQMLAAMPLAMSLGIGPMPRPMVTAYSMDLNGNAITVSNALYERMQAVDPVAMKRHPISAKSLKSVIDENRKSNGKPLTFAMVFPYSTHNYELRYWMASGGIDPDRDISLVVVPPAQMVSQLENGTIDGYCVGEPWNTLAVEAGLGQILITKYEIWNNSPEKVLGVTQEWAEQYPHTHQALIMALLDASSWLDDPQNRLEAATLISRPVYVNAPEHVVRMSMTGTFKYAGNALPRSLPDFNVFHRYAANFPWRSHAIWYLTQMVRWGQVDQAIDFINTAESVYRPEIYREAAYRLGIDTPEIDYKREGHHAGKWQINDGDSSVSMGADQFLDQRYFDPFKPLEYLNNFEIHHINIALADLAELNVAQNNVAIRQPIV
jgi:nitrate/nitrite transport system substrate-binding protein